MDGGRTVPVSVTIKCEAECISSGEDMDALSRMTGATAIMMREVRSRHWGS
jgi:hypothetical protein